MSDDKNLLDESFNAAEAAFLSGNAPLVSEEVARACDVIFSSKTQAYREVLLGCLLTRIADKSKDVRLPYMGLGPNAFNGRTLDEQVINPFLHERSVPCSKGPYLNVFRRSVSFVPATRDGLRDKRAYDAFLVVLGIAEKETDDATLKNLLNYVLFRFVGLREAARIELISLERISLTQYERIVSGLLARRSGGLFPVVLVLSMIEAINSHFSLEWHIEWQDINVADRASGAGGDITIRENGDPMIIIEVTERAVDASQLRAAFKDKIAPAKPSDYVFMVHLVQISDQAKQQAETYFVQGYDVNFVDIKEWLVNALVTVGVRGRKGFQQNMIRHLGGKAIPRTLKVMWNDEIQKIITH